jgi:hypothetical protein
MGRPLLYGADGHTAVAFEKDETQERALLLAAFGVLAGINRHGRPVDEGRLYEARQGLAAAIVDALGQDVVEGYFNIRLAPTENPGPPLPEAGGVQ